MVGLRIMLRAHTVRQWLPTTLCFVGLMMFWSACSCSKSHLQSIPYAHHLITRRLEAVTATSTSLLSMCHEAYMHEPSMIFLLFFFVLEAHCRLIHEFVSIFVQNCLTWAYHLLLIQVHTYKDMNLVTNTGWSLGASLMACGLVVWSKSRKSLCSWMKNRMDCANIAPSQWSTFSNMSSIDGYLVQKSRARSCCRIGNPSSGSWPNTDSLLSYTSAAKLMSN